MSSFEVSCVLKGCNSKFIDRIVMLSINGNDISSFIIDKAFEIVNSYDENKCIEIITIYGNIQNTYLKLRSNTEIEKIGFYRQIALFYVKKIIESKIIAKFDKYIFKKEVAAGRCNSTCSICLENIETDIQYTRCNHAFHRTCMTKWGKNTCPMCRTNI